mgnify:CR=1 FL=1
MSERQANMRGWAAYAGILLTLLSGLVIWSMKAGEIIHEVKGLRDDLKEIKLQVVEDRREVKEALKDLSTNHRELERRVEVLEVHDSQHWNGYQKAK